MPHRVPSFTLAPQTTGLPCQLEDSWQRSLNYGLHRDDDTQPWVARSMLKDARAENAWISQLVAPLLARLQPELSSHPSIMVMSDATGLVLETHGNADFLHKAQRYALAPGNLWGEHARGTNAIGTALAMQRHCEVSGGEHYLNRNAGLFCSASPVFRPDGTVAGVLDISTPAQLPKHDAAALIRRAVCQIEHAWAASTVSADRWLLSLHSDASVLGSAQELLLIFEQNTLLGANKLAIDEFCLTPGHFGATAIETLFPGITLNAGETTLEASNRQRYYARQTTPTRRYMGVASPARRLRLTRKKRKRCGLSMPGLPCVSPARQEAVKSIAPASYTAAASGGRVILSPLTARPCPRI
jgi:transcriptional regulator of acetoin/glycerol metabolism